MNITAAVIVTTPQRLSFVDVVKGIDMFDTVNIPCIAVVENMAALDLYDFNDEFYSTLSKRILNTPSTLNEDSLKNIVKTTIEEQRRPSQIFGTGYTQRIREMWGIENIITLPLEKEVSTCGDIGTPYVLKHPKSIVSKAMIELAGGIIEEIENIESSQKYAAPTIRFDEAQYSIVVDDSKSIKPYDLRCRCKCAVCVEELSGRKLLDEKSVPLDIKPRSMMPIGRYAISVDWSDGHKSLFPYKQLFPA